MRVVLVLYILFLVSCIFPYRFHKLEVLMSGYNGGWADNAGFDDSAFGGTGAAAANKKKIDQGALQDPNQMDPSPDFSADVEQKPLDRDPKRGTT